MPPIITYAGLTDIGQIREVNEDAFSIDPEIGLMVVADGLGGHRAGDIASEFVVENLPRQLAIGRAAGIEDIHGTERLLVQSLLIIAEQLYDMGCSEPEHEGMGATVVSGLATETILLIAHLGDSRAYQLREGILERLTHDHSLGNDLRDNGIIHRDAEDIPEYQTLRRFIGMENPLPPDIAVIDLKEHDRFLLCSDGLTNMVDDIDISNVLMGDASCEEICEQLVARANRAGGYDNITVIVADVQSTDSHNTSHDEEAKEISQMNTYKVPPDQQMIHEGTSRDRQKG